MTTRRRWVTAGGALLLAAAGAALWFGVICERTKPQDEEPNEPLSPTARLLVGSWLWVETASHDIAPGVEIVCEFTKDGRFFFRITDPLRGLRVSGGTYRLDGTTLWLTRTASPMYEAKTWDLSIELVTADRLVLLARPDPDDPEPPSPSQHIRVTGQQ